MFSDSFAGIAPSSVPGFVVAQLMGGMIAIGVVRILYPEITPGQAAEAVVSQKDSAEPVAARSA